MSPSACSISPGLAPTAPVKPSSHPEWWHEAPRAKIEIKPPTFVLHAPGPIAHSPAVPRKDDVAAPFFFDGLARLFAEAAAGGATPFVQFSEGPLLA